MEKTKLNWEKQDNDYLNKIFDIINIVLAFVVILAPIISLAMCLIGLSMDVLNVYIMFFIVYILTKIIYFSINFRFIKFRKLDLLEILGLSLMIMMLVSAVINFNFLLIDGSNFFTFLIVFDYFFVFLIFLRLDKKYYKKLLYTFILTLTVCSIMGICDLHNKFMPGFDEHTLPMSLQFRNPNYSGYITIMAIVLCIYALCNYKKIAEQVIFWLCFVVLNVALFINGCYSAETAMFVAELFLLIYFWIKNKKCPWIILTCMLISIGSSFVWIKGISTSNANYMFESLAVIDNKLGTHLVKRVSTFFDKIFHTGIIEEVAGSDGWDREDLTTIAFREITSSTKMVLFGGGSGYNYDVRVHNVYIQIWLEYGIFNVLLYVSILAVLIWRVFKTKFTSHNMFLIATMIAVVFICHYFGGLDLYSFTYYTCLLAIFVKKVNEKYLEKKEVINQKNQEKFYSGTTKEVGSNGNN